jgi:hypothetical protein
VKNAPEAVHSIVKDSRRGIAVIKASLLIEILNEVGAIEVRFAYLSPHREEAAFGIKWFVPWQAGHIQAGREFGHHRPNFLLRGQFAGGGADKKEEIGPKQSRFFEASKHRRTVCGTSSSMRCLLDRELDFISDCE